MNDTSEGIRRITARRASEGKLDTADAKWCNPDQHSAGKSSPLHSGGHTVLQRLGVSVLLLIAAAGIVPVNAGASLRNPRKHLVLDSRVLERVDGAKPVLGTVEKEIRNPLFQADKPWENALNNLYPNVLYDEEERLFKLWYKCVLNDKDVIAKMMPPATVHDQGWFLLYATSRDGLAWEKPALGLHGFDGSTRNNAVARDTPNVGVFSDPHDPDPARRYKMVYDVGSGKMRVRFSPDGLRWTEPVVPEGLAGAGDTHNNAFWDERLGKYVLITRLFLGERLVARSESTDFLHWERPAVVLRSTAEEDKTHQTYCMPAFPYANVYLGYVMMYHVGTDRTVDCELAWSPDSVAWKRVAPGTPFLPRGPKGSYDSACIYAPAGPPIVRDDRIWIYYGGSAAVHRGWKRHCLPCLARLRVDGFAGYQPADVRTPAHLTTAPLCCTDEPLRVSADATGGTLRVEVIGAEGYSLEACEPIARDVTDAVVRWKGGKDLSQLSGQTYRLRFELSAATLYAFSGVELLAAAK